MVKTDEIKKIIEQAVPQSIAHVSDPNCDGEHFQAIVVSPVFEGMMLVKQHQMVMKALKEAFAQSVHALSLKTLTPEQWEKEKSNHNPNSFQGGLHGV
ncbi:MAG: BolA/IbaG family iron-sulfur metabolism protein [Candidatus Omnitrophota bacterium]